MAGAIQLKTERTTLNEAKPDLPYFENIVHKKVNNVALTCFECFVHWFFTTALVSCLLPFYDRLYKAEVAKLSAGNSEPAVPTPVLALDQEAAITEVASRSLLIAPTEDAGKPQNNSPDLSVSLANGDNTSILPTHNIEQSAPIIAPAAVSLPVITPFLRGGELHDYTAGKIAGLRINSETHYRDGTYQYLTLNSYKVLLYAEGPRADRDNNHFPKDKVIIRDSTEHPGKIEIVEYSNLLQRDWRTWVVDPAKLYLRTYENLDGDEVTEHVYLTHVAVGRVGFGDGRYLRLISRSLPIVNDPSTQQAGNPSDLPVSLTTDLPLEEMYNADSASVLPTDSSEKAPEIVAPADIAPPVITPFLRKGELHDYTAEKIASLRINHEVIPRDGKPYQYLTLNSYKVLLYGEGPRHDRANNHFNLHEGDEVIIKDSVKDPGKIEIIEYSGFFQRNSIYLKIDPTKLYLRTYENSNGDIATEHVYLTHIAEERLRPGDRYLTLIE